MIFCVWILSHPEIGSAKRQVKALRVLLQLLEKEEQRLQELTPRLDLLVFHRVLGVNYAAYHHVLRCRLPSFQIFSVPEIATLFIRRV